ncbi:MAG TPA: CHAT domain-containing protein [Vicinamibacteria bacterium]|nr:CHAT domain-containing protein [Vicinamibacteria bacterium]
MSRSCAAPRALAMLLCVGVPASALAAAGVEVVTVARKAAGETAGLRPGDVLSEWDRGAASGTLESPFDLAEVELEQGPRGPVRLRGTRAGEPLSVSIFPDGWGLELRPRLAPAAATAHDAARRACDAKDATACRSALAELRARLAGSALPDLEPWLSLEDARAAAARRDPDGVASAVEQGVLAAHRAQRPHVEAQLLAFLGWRLRDADRLADAARALERVLKVRRAIAPASLATASLGEPIGIVAYAQGGAEDERDEVVAQAQATYEREAPDSVAHARALIALGWLQGHPKGRQSFARALALVERLAPESLAAATVVRAAAWIEPDLERKTELNQRALRIQEDLAPDTREMVASLAAVAQATFQRGDVAEALEVHRRALALVERIAPGSARHAHTLNGLGVYWVQRGDLAQAEAFYRAALAIDERLVPGSVLVGIRLFNLGELLTRRRDYEQADTYLTRALELSEKYSPGGGVSGRILYVLGQARLGRGDAAGAEAVLRRSLEILERQVPDQLPAARERLGDVLAERGELDEAEALYRQNLEQAERSDQGPLVLADRHHALGALSWRRGDVEAAERQFRAALELRRQVVPDSMWLAESSHALGLVARQRGRRDDALTLFREAVAALEVQGRRLGGSEEARARFRARYQECYRDLEELLLDLGREREAFDVVERGRARGMAVLLASRDLDLSEGAVELERERRDADRAHDRAFQALNARGLEPAERERRAQDLARARQAQEDVRARLRASDPRQTGLRDPEPLDLAGVRRVLEPHTALLAYSLGPASGRVYVVGPEPDAFAVFRLAAGSEEVRAEVRRFREAIESSRSRLGRAALTARAQRLGELLLGPAARAVDRAERVVVMPDGALYLVPWAALQRTSDGRPLVDTKPLHVVSSVSLLATLKRPSAPSGGAVHVVGFGDPAYSRRAAPPEEPADTLTRAQSSGLSLHPLPATRREVESLRMLRAEAQLYLGRDATEERAKALGPDARFVHFACHGFLDERLPLESGLALATPEGAGGRENGFLQAWEVFERVRLDADLVTLSACRSGLGQELAGEGLLGLAWAFQYAGARSVLASLWEVSDDSTADLMGRFYRHLVAGRSKAEALRRAQAELRRRPATSAPYFWAAFTLVGDGS